MGQCIGKHNNRSRSGGRTRVRRSNRNSQDGNSFRQASGSSVQQSAPIALVGDISTGMSDTRQNADNNSNLMPTERASRSITPENMRRREQEKHIGRLVLDTLRKIRTMIDSEHPPPQSLLTLHRQAESEEGWLMVLRSIVDTIPIDDPLGPAVVNLIIEECPLPSKESITSLCWRLELHERANMSVQMQSNILVILSCLAEKMAGPGSISLLTSAVRDYVIASLNPSNDFRIILFALVALEKFCQTSENKRMLLQFLQSAEGSDFMHSLLTLEQWWRRSENDYLRWQVGFCATWCLDNIFIIQGRKLSYETVSLEGINAMLNNDDVSEYLKISSDGLEARCDALSFESVRCTHHSDSGVWYYEVLIITNGVMQIGWATKDSKFLNHEGYGIGDDEYSVAFDGCRKLVWHNAQSELIDKEWKPGDILGVLLDLTESRVVFSLNGDSLPPHTRVFSCAKQGFFAAASFMSFQQCRFNFGSEPYRYPPSINYQSFNSQVLLSPAEKIILPRHLKLRAESQLSIIEDACTVCCAKKACMYILPCKHRGFCLECTMQLENCPMCREVIQSREHEDCASPARGD